MKRSTQKSPRTRKDTHLIVLAAVAAFVALLLFVGIPLPGTGAWTGTLAASFLNMGIKSTTLAVSLGVIIAGIIMGVVAMTGVHVFGL